jgi:enoyl-CoA hydratase
MSAEPEVLFSQDGALGRIVLNRPKALNALTLGMVRAMDAQLRQWARDPSVKAVAVEGAGERAFCAGGDIRALYDSGKAGDPYAIEFYREEYVLNTLIKRYPKPYLAFIRGIVMGGGVGVSVHGSHRIAGEGIVFAMPETGIGLFPDVGGTYFLPRCPGETGMYLALTGGRLNLADALYAGVATQAIPVALWPEALAALAKDGDPRALPAFGAVRPASALEENRQHIDHAFSAGSVEEILSRLDAMASPFGAETAKTLRTKSPTSLKVVYAQVRAGRDLSFEDCMRLEFRLTNRFMRGHDFYEGVRAAIIDKDQAPKWRPDTLQGVSEADVAAYFAALAGDELVLG